MLMMHTPAMKKSIIAIILIVFVVYGFSLPNQFLWDDEEAVVQNELIHSLANLPKFWTGGIFNSHGSGLSGGFYRPVTTTVMAVLWAVSHGPWIFRLFQISTHAIASVLLFFFLRTWFPLWPAFIGSAMFGIHPGTSEAVLWISTIADPLSAVFLLSSLLLVARHRKYAAWLFFLALLTKEGTAVFLPVFFLLPHTISRRKTAFWFIAAAALYGIMRILAVGMSTSSLAFPSPIAQATFIQRLLTIPSEILFYFQTFLWPFSLSVSRHFVITNPSSVQFWGSLFLISLLIMCLVKFCSRTLVFFSLWFFLGIIPYLQLVPLSATVADRWLYLPSIGLIGVILSLLPRVKKYTSPARVALVTRVTIAALLLALGVTTIIRSRQWQNGLTLFSHDIRVNPDSFDLANNYGVEIFRSGDIGAARQAFDRSIRLNPAWWVAYNNAGAVWERLGDTAKTEALYRTSIEKGNYYLAYENLAKLLFFQKKDHKEAQQAAAQGLRQFPTSVNLWLVYAIASYEVGEHNEAVSAARQLYALSPSGQTAEILSRITNNLPLEFPER